MTRRRIRRGGVAPAAPPPPPAPTRGWRQDLMEVLCPAARWHHVFPAAVVLAALAYWVASLFLQAGASGAEIVLYRPRGDCQVYPVITALSQLNFGDPTDALVHGQGVGGFQAVILLPYAVAFALAGPAGYAGADAVLSWVYFVAVTLLLRRAGAGPVAAPALGAALATHALPLALHPVSRLLRALVGACGRSLVEWDFPDLTALVLFEKRIPRPLVTEPLLVLLFYFLLRQWRERRLPSARRGLALGGLMALLVQGDPYAFSAVGLLLLAVLGATVWGCRALPSGRFAAGALAGALVLGAYFLFQLWYQNPEAAVRFGLAPFPRSRLLLLPGHGPWLRLAVVVVAGLTVAWLARRAAAAPARPPWPDLVEVRSVSLFAILLAACGFFAMPLQLLLLGQGAQVYHYFYFTFPAFYGYALVLLGVQLARVPGRPRVAAATLAARLPAWARRGVAAAAALALLLLPVAEDVRSSRRQGTARTEASPWAAYGDSYRLHFRALDQWYREDPRLRESRTFTTFCHEANFLLTAFHGKRAWLPDNAYSTLGDAELERRLFLSARLCQFTPQHFHGAMGNHFFMNYWLGCAKYWCADDHKFAPENEYTPWQLEEVRALGPLPPFNLVVPLSERRRLNQAYADFLREPLDPAACPDTVVLTAVLWEQGVAPRPDLYEQVFRNEIFAIYLKKPRPAGSAGPR